MGMRRTIILAAAAMLSALSIPSVAGAHHCDDLHVDLNSLYASPTGVQVTAPNEHPGVDCQVNAVAPQESVDGRKIYPGAQLVQAVWLGDLGSGVPTLRATLNGMGFRNYATTLTRDGANGYYPGAALVIPDGPALAGGSITVTVTLPNGSTKSGTWTTAA